MGDISFNIIKDVNLNKTVNLDINKNVNVNVENKDLLATAEADAEAFGLHGLAEVDAYTYVNEEEGDEPIPSFSSGQLQFEGNVGIFEVPPGEVINIVYSQGADVDDFNAIEHFSDLDGDPAPPADTGLPQPTLDISDITLNPLLDLEDPPGTNEDLWEYTNESPIVIDFGTRNVERDGISGFNPCETGNLTAIIPEGSIFDVLFEEVSGAVEVALQLDTLSSPPAVLIFDPDCDSAECIENTETFTMLADLDFTADSLGSLAAYEFNMQTDDIVWYDCIGGDGEAFAYAESTAAIDLDGIM